MSTLTRLTPALLVFAILASGGTADAGAIGGAPEAPSLYQLDDTPRSPAAGRFAIEDAEVEFLVTTDPSVVASDPQSILLDIPYGPRLEALRTDFVDYGPEWKSWFGTLRQAGDRDEGTGYVYLGYHGRRVTGLIHFRGERYRIVGGIDGPQRLVRQSDELAETPSCGLHPGDGARPLTADSKSYSPETLLAPICGSPPPKSLTLIDLMVVFPEVHVTSPASYTALVDYVEDSVALANDAFSGSYIAVAYRLVHVGPVVETQPPFTSLRSALDLLNEELGEISALRDAFGADLVAMIVPFSWNLNTVCGVANLPVNNETDYVSGQSGLQGAPFGQRAYAAVRENCGFGDFTLAHELAHTYGMWHEDALSEGSLLASDAKGYDFIVDMEPKATVMACSCEQDPGTPGDDCPANANPICDRVPRFSDPDNSYQGVTVGVAGQADNTALGCSRILNYVGFRPASSNSPPVASFTVSCNSATRVCSFDAGGTTDDGTVVEYHWRFGDGTSTTTTTPTVSHTYGGSASSFWVHLLATDDGGQRDLAIAAANL